jgi:hypothetical protein
MIDELKLYKKPDSSTKIYTLLACTSNLYSLPFKLGERVLYLGQIPNMNEKCVVVDSIGRVHWPVNNTDFGVVPDEKI